MSHDELESALTIAGVTFEHVDADERERALKAWLSTFACDVKKRTGQWVHEGFRWHGFSYGFQPALNGTAALDAYRNQWMARFIVFDEIGTWCASCHSAAYPDLSFLRQDLYVSHHNMKWTMAFTHEQPDIGPFFCSSEKGWSPARN